LRKNTAKNSAIPEIPPNCYVF